MDKSFLIVTIVAAIIDILILIWWRCSCEWTKQNSKFPTRGHVLLVSIVALCPLVNIIMFPILTGIYLGMRVSGDIRLKKNKFNKYWFDIE